MNLDKDTIDSILKKIFDLTKSDLPLDEEKVNVQQKLMLSCAIHKINTGSCANAVSYLPDTSFLSEHQYPDLFEGLAELKKLYLNNRKEINDILFLLDWYTRECKEEWESKRRRK